jgi:ribosomal protein S18 acetylase RimI-like enzyme
VPPQVYRLRGLKAGFNLRHSNIGWNLLKLYRIGVVGMELQQDKIAIRWANKEDAAFLAGLNEEFNEVRMPQEQVERSLAAGGELVVIGFWKGEPAAFACAQCFSSFCYGEPYAELTEMYVRESARRRGLAGGMIVLLEEGLRERGVRSLKLLTGMDNAAAIAAYKHAGFASLDHLPMEKRL